MGRGLSPAPILFLERKITMDHLNISIIDKSKDIEVIKAKYGAKYYFNKKAHQAAAEMWGVKCNDHGTVLNRQEETIAEFKSCKATLKIAGTNKGYWLIGLNCQSSYNGFGYAPSVWDKKGFASYWDARLFAVEEFISFFNKVSHSSDSCNSEQNKQNARKVLEILKSERTPQISLF